MSETRTRVMMTPQRFKKAVSLFNEGLSFNEIAAQIGVSPSSVSRWAEKIKMEAAIGSNESGINWKAKYLELAHRMAEKGLL